MRYALITITGFVALIPVTSSATIMGVDFVFDDPDWSATATYDDATGVAWSFDATLTVYDIASLVLSQANVATWDETELGLGATLPDYGLVVDILGRTALFVSGVDSLTSTAFGTGIGHFGDGLITYSEVTILGGGGFTYIASTVQVPEPATLTMLVTGLFGLRLARSKRRRLSV